MCEFCFNLFILFVWEGFETKVQNPNTIKENTDKCDIKNKCHKYIQKTTDKQCKYLYTILQLEG